MPYTHTTWGDLKNQLALRLADSAKIFWTDVELGIQLSESLRAFGLLSAFWRNRGTLNTAAGSAFYNITTSMPSLLGFSVTDRDVIQQLQYHLLESATSQAAWNGTEMFNLSDLRYAIQRRRDQFLSDTGIVVSRSIVDVASPPIGRETLVDTVIDVRRASWISASPESYYSTIWRDDERTLTAADQGWSVNPGIPEAYSILAPPPLTIQFSPIPISSGQVELLTVDSGAALNPASAATVLGIPDDLTPAIKWGALADLLGKDGIARDPTRAQFCEQRYRHYVILARMLPVVLHAEINGMPLIPCTLQELESYSPTWENLQGSPSEIAIASSNMIAISPVPDGVYSVVLDVVQRAPVPTLDSDQLQLGREQLDMILDYAEHLALFKVGGAEWLATVRASNNFLLQSATYNQRLSAAARAALSASEQSQRQKQGIPRRNELGIGVGSLKGVPNA